MSSTPQRGFTLLIAVVLTSVLLSVGLALLDVAYKQILLSSTASQSTVAFYAADSVLECALYWDQQFTAFDFQNPLTSVTCRNIAIPLTTSVSGSTRTTTFDVPCVTGGVLGEVTAYKDSNGDTSIYATGYSTCDTAFARRIERGLKITYP